MFTLKFTIVNLMFIIQSSVFNNQYSIFGLGCSHFRNSMFRCSLSMSLFTVQGSFTNQCSPFNSQYSTLQCSLFKLNVHCSNSIFIVQMFKINIQSSLFTVQCSNSCSNSCSNTMFKFNVQCSNSMFDVQSLSPVFGHQCSMFRVQSSCSLFIVQSSVFRVHHLHFNVHFHCSIS